VTRVAESEVVQMTIGEAAAAIDVATLLLHTGRDYAPRKCRPAAGSPKPRPCAPAATWSTPSTRSPGHSKPVRDGRARWVYDRDETGAIRRDVMTILTHHAASRQAAMAPYGKMLLAATRVSLHTSLA